MMAALALVALAAVSSTMTTAYTSRDTGISGYAVSGLSFDLGAVGDVSTVSFRLSPAGARTVRVQVSAAGSWVDCTVKAGNASCDVPEGTSAASLDQLAVLASS